MPKNYYIILGIPSDSTQEDIKSAYRRLAKKFHPDHYGKKQTPFQIIQEAYTVLGNPLSRKDYDNSLQPVTRQVPVSASITPLHLHAEEDLEPLIPEGEMHGREMTAVDRPFPHQWSMFDNAFEQLLGGFTERSQSYLKSSKDVIIEVTLSPIQAQRGGNVRLNLPIKMHCPTCYRSSALGYSCWRCNGTGILQGERPVIISYPAGIRNNHSMKLAIPDLGDQPYYLNVIFRIR